MMKRPRTACGRACGALAGLLTFVGCEPSLDASRSGDGAGLRYVIFPTSVCDGPCTFDRPFAAGAVTEMFVAEGPRIDPLVARFAPADAGTATMNEDEKCRSAVSRTRTPVAAPCPEPDRVLSRSVAVVPARSGTHALEVLDARGNVFDRLEFDAATPTRIVLEPERSNDVEGIVEHQGPAITLPSRRPVVFVAGTRVSLRATLFDDDEILTYTFLPDVFTSSDPQVVEVAAASIRKAGVVLFARAEGKATLSARFGERSFTLEVEVAGPT